MIEHHPYLRPDAPMHDLFEAARHRAQHVFDVSATSPCREHFQ